jgi:anaerobic dimethyl sulfoxide reductase subunit B
MSTRLGFRFDAASCSGCKACQIACKDRHGLPVGLLRRRVYEVTGGGWTRRDAAWVSDVFAYHLSISCHHCRKPICAEICPARAITQRADGIVLLDEEKCLGCRYCSWACPYGAPQFDDGRGRMSKCSFCAEDIDRGNAPACVAACPMRALDYGPLEVSIEARVDDVGQSPYPPPPPDLTEPSYFVTPHSDQARAVDGSARIGNREEVEP